MDPVSVIYGALAIAAAIIAVRWLLARRYRRGRQVEYRIGRGSGTGEVLAVNGLRLRVRSLSSEREHTVWLTNVRRR